MKIVLVTRNQFKCLWAKTIPAERIDAGLHTPSLVIPHLSIIILIKEDVTVLSAAEFSDLQGPSDLEVKIAKNELFEVG